MSEDASLFRNKGVDSRWVEVDLGKDGVWHKHFSGRFDDKTAARNYIAKHGLTDAIILEAPWEQNEPAKCGLKKKRNGKDYESFLRINADAIDFFPVTKG